MLMVLNNVADELSCEISGARGIPIEILVLPPRTNIVLQIAIVILLFLTGFTVASNTMKGL